MSTVMKLLSLLLCFELIVGPMRGTIITSNLAQATECPAGQVYNTDRQRCLLSQEVIDINNAVDSCKDISDAAQKRECYKANAQSEFNKNVDEGSSKKADEGKVGTNEAFFKDDASGEQKGIVKAANAAAVAIPLLIATNVLLNRWSLDKKQRSAYKCRPNSLLLMYAGAAALGAGEVIGTITHRNKMKDLKEKWEEVAPSSGSTNSDQQQADATEAQSQAFEFLAQNEEQIAKTAKLKKGFYIASTGLFAAGAIAAVVEKVQLHNAKFKEIPGGQKDIATGTSTNNMGLVTSGKARIKNAKDTINKLTCHSDEAAESGDKDLKNADDTLANDQKSKSELAARDERIKSYDEKHSALNDKIAEKEKLMNDPNVSQKTKDQLQKDINALEQQRTELETQYNKDIESQKSTNSNKNNNNTQNPSQENTNQPLGNPQDYHDEWSCEGAGFKWQDMGYKGGGCFGANLIPKKNEREREIAIYNLSTAENAEQLMQLIHEYEAVELENYSRVSYLSESDSEALKPISLGESLERFVSSQVIPKAQAKDEGGGSNVMGYVTGALAILPMLGGILKDVKFKGGKPVSAAELEGDKSAVRGKLDKAIGNPTTRIAINGVLGGWIGVMSWQMDKQQKLSEERAKKLREIKVSFESASGIINCTPADRDDPGKPKCYCFTSDNKFNPARSSSKICSTKFAALKYDVNKLNTSNVKVCVDQNFGVDPSCSCRNRKGSDGKNTCMKTTAGFNTAGFSPGTFKMISTGAGPANDLFNGVYSGADITDSGTINAARIKKAADDMLAKTDPKGAAAVNKMAKDLERSLLATAGGYSMASSASRPIPMNPKAAAEELKKEIEENKGEIDVTTAGKVESGGGSDTPAEEMPEFGMTEDMANAQETEIAEVMSQNLDMGGSDINTGSSTNIFEVLSNRYQRSGMRRLFDEKGETKADAPAKTDITE